MKTISIEEVAREATQAALAVIDAATDGTSRKGRSPAGDALAFAMDALIQQLAAQQPHGKPKLVVAKREKR